LGEEHPFAQKMDKTLQDSAVKIKGVIERQNKRVTNKYANPASVSGKNAKPMNNTG